MNCESKGEICRYKDGESNKNSSNLNDIKDISLRGAVYNYNIVAGSKDSEIPRICSLTDNTKCLDLSMDQLELLYTYMNQTCYHVAPSKNKNSLQIWKDHVPKVGLQHRFLTHSLLALSSMHLHRLRQGTGNFDQIAVMHYHEAARLMALEMSHISALNAEPILLSSALALLLSYAMVDLVPFVKNCDSELDIFALSTGPRQISVGFWDFFSSKDSLYPLLALQSDEGFENGKKLVYLPFIASLRQIIVDMANLGKFSREHEKCYVQTVQCLEHWTARAVISLDETCLTVFPMFAWDNDYVYLLREKHPMAQIILAYYCGTLHSIHDRFWIGKRPYNEIRVISTNLEPEWSKFLEWPMKASAMTEFSIPMLADAL